MRSYFRNRPGLSRVRAKMYHDAGEAPGMFLSLSSTDLAPLANSRRSGSINRTAMCPGHTPLLDALDWSSDTPLNYNQNPLFSKPLELHLYHTLCFAALLIYRFC